jgi:undecaprenyl-diphosphatase
MAEQASDKPVEKAKVAAQEAAKKETAPRPQREYRTFFFQVSLVLAIATFAVLTFMVKAFGSFPLDLQITRGLQSINSPIFDGAMRLISWFGFAPQSFIIPLVVVVLLYLFGFHWEAISALFAALFPAIINVAVKDYIRRPRPGVDLVHVFKILDSYSFPSGHVMYYVGFFGFLWFLAYTLLKHSWWRTLLLILFGVLVALVGVSRVYVGEHWASDALGAYLLGSITLVVVFWFYRWGKKRFFVRQPVAPEKPKASS